MTLILLAESKDASLTSNSVFSAAASSGAAAAPPAHRGAAHRHAHHRHRVEAEALLEDGREVVHLEQGEPADVVGEADHAGGGLVGILRLLGIL
jgi:hypothetical protein